MAVLLNSKHPIAAGSELNSDFLNWVLSVGLPNLDCDWSSPQALEVLHDF